jgi:ABC-type antimicrobial peptide transport system permease subunit
MGIRIALGAARDQVIRMVMREMLATIVLGLAIGAGLAALAAPVLERALYQVSAVDGLSFGVGALVLAAVAALATYVPAVRAARADPVEALRVQ